VVWQVSGVPKIGGQIATDSSARFYPTRDFAARLFPGWRILADVAGTAESRVAYAGTNLPYYLLGSELKNDVRYININAHADWMPHDYHRARVVNGDATMATDPWPQWYRTEASYHAWLANLRRNRIDVLFVARENRHGRLGDVAPQFPIERTWADQHPDVFLDLGPFENPPDGPSWVRVYRLRGTP
jgi:hypothetical protein